MTTANPNGPGYWSEDAPDAARARAREVLEALRVYRAAETAMRRRTREAMGMGENELLTLRYLLRAEQEHRTVTPGALARYLGITTASMTAIIDRLERSGHVERRPHPTDRRSILVAATADSHTEVRRTLGRMHERMYTAVRGFDEEESATVLRFLHTMQDAVDQVDPSHDSSGG